MEKISEMIEQLRSIEIEKVMLNTIATISIGEFVHKDRQNPKAPYPVYNGGSTYTGFYDRYNNTAHKILISARGATAGFVNRVDCNYWAGNSSYTIDVLSPNANWEYVYYYLKKYQPELIASQQKGGGVPAVSKKQIENLQIPLPPLPIQQEIVRILDTFTQLQSNLEAELAARQKQYEYYRNKLLTFDKDDESVEWKTLGEIGTIYKGKGIQKADFTDVGKPCIHYGQVHTFYGSSATETKSFISEELYSSSNKAIFGDIIIATTSEDVEACCKSTVWLGDGEPAISGDAHYYRHNQNPKYMGYLFMTEMFAIQKRTAAVGAKVTRVHGDSILKFKFPFPSLCRQQEIVSILDTFESLITNLKQEIEARKKQYEYYREQLLTF